MRFDILDLEVEAGRYSLEVRVDDEVVGTSLLTLLAENRVEPVVRSDVDLTYLETDFRSTLAMLKLFIEPAREKVALPGLATIYRALRGDNLRPTTL